jgi:hypothetical protein
VTLADFTVEILWDWFQSEGVDGCPCGCSWNGRLWAHRDQPDEMMYDHIAMDKVDPQPCTRLENHWRHYCRWGHDGKNPFGGKAAALPTWIDRHAAS